MRKIFVSKSLNTLDLQKNRNMNLFNYLQTCSYKSISFLSGNLRV